MLLALADQPEDDRKQDTDKIIHAVNELGLDMGSALPIERALRNIRGLTGAMRKPALDYSGMARCRAVLVLSAVTTEKSHA